MSSIKEGEYYINTRKSQETHLKKDLDVIEGFHVASRKAQIKFPDNFKIPSGSDPGQTVMCKRKEGKYVKIEVNSTYLNIAELQVFDENGKNVAKTGNYNYSDNFKTTTGLCRTTASGKQYTGYPGSINRGEISVGDCERICTEDTNCTAYEYTNQLSSKGLSTCWTYRDPTVTGNGDSDKTCMVRQRKEETPIATMSSFVAGTNPYMALDGLRTGPIIHTSSPAAQGGWLEVDLGKEVRIKKVVVYNRTDCCLDRLNGAKLTILDKDFNQIWSTTLNSDAIQRFNVRINEKECGGPVVEKNMDDLDELKNLQDEYNVTLSEYNNAMKYFIENSQQYVNATNKATNKYRNTYAKLPNGAIGYVTSKGVWKWMPNPTIADSIQGKNGCPNSWSSAPSIGWGDDNQEYNLWDAEEGQMVLYDGIPIIKGTDAISNQTCFEAGKNIYSTVPNPTTNLKNRGCKSGNPGTYQSDLGWTTVDNCKQRAEDKGSNTFYMGRRNGSKGLCYVGGDANSGAGGGCSSSMGGNWRQEITYGEFLEGYKGPRMGWDAVRNWFQDNFPWNPYVTNTAVYRKYTTNNANITSLGKVYHVTDNIQTKQYPDGMTKYGSAFQHVGKYDSGGNDIECKRLNGLSVNQVKQRCIELGGAGFVINENYYCIKNDNMWPRGNRQPNNNWDLYIRKRKPTNSDPSCSKTTSWSTQALYGGYRSETSMNTNTKCSLGKIKQQDLIFINEQYNKLNMLLNKIKLKIDELSAEDVILNDRLLREYKLMRKRLEKYEDVYKEIKYLKESSKQDGAMEEDAQLNMLSSNKTYILWSILAIVITTGAMKTLKH